ncbi:MAG: hypothetical protein J0G30_00130 [Actinomycetales bacterium]|nr:hypothetical protein [Actinomycetales bacterium]
MTDVTVTIRRIQRTIMPLPADFDPEQPLDEQFDWDYLSARLHEDTELIDIVLAQPGAPLVRQSITDIGDPFVLVEGGLVQNDPELPVFDLDILKADFIDADDIQYARELSGRACYHGFTETAARLDAFVASYQEEVTDDGR